MSMPGLRGAFPLASGGFEQEAGERFEDDCCPEPLFDALRWGNDLAVTSCYRGQGEGKVKGAGSADYAYHGPVAEERGSGTLWTGLPKTMRWVLRLC